MKVSAVEEISPPAPRPAPESETVPKSSPRANPDFVDPADVSPAADPFPELLGAVLLAGLAAALGTGLVLAVGDAGFGWLGAGSTAAVLGSILARRAGRAILATLLGTTGFFGTSILACAATLLAGLAAFQALLV